MPPAVLTVIVIVNLYSVQGEKAQSRSPCVKHKPVKQGQTTTPGNRCSTLCDECVGSLTSPADYITLKITNSYSLSVCALVHVCALACIRARACLCVLAWVREGV